MRMVRVQKGGKVVGCWLADSIWRVVGAIALDG